MINNTMNNMRILNEIYLAFPKQLPLKEPVFAQVVWDKMRLCT